MIFAKAIKIPPKEVVAEAASPVVFVYVEIKPPTSSNETPRLAAIPSCGPKTAASSSALNIPV